MPKPSILPMKRGLFVLFQFLSFLCTYGQPGFNRIIDLGYNTNHFRDMLVDNDTIIAYGLGYKDTIDWQQGLLLVKIDSFGNVLASKIITDSLGDHLSISKPWGKIIKTTDGGYAMTAATVHRRSTFLIKTDHKLNVSFIQEYHDSINLANYFYQIIQKKCGYFIYGATGRPSGFNDASIRSVDSLGATNWIMYFGGATLADGFVYMDKVNDSLYIVAGVFGVTATSSYSSIKYIDHHGNIVREWNSAPEPEIGYLRKIMYVNKNKVLTFGLRVVDMTPGGTKLVQPTLAELDSNFQIVWIRQFGPIRSLVSDIIFWDIEPTLDGNYIGAGETGIKNGNEPTIRTGWLYKFSPEGDSLWQRTDIASFPVSIYNDHFFGGVGVLSSGNIVAGGGTSQGNKYYGWLVKVTPDGCLDTLYCQTSALGERETDRLPELQVYPNPASQRVQIELPQTAEYYTLAVCRLSDGRQVFGAAHPEQPVCSVDVSDWPAGLYAVVARSKDGVWRRAVFQVVR